ncbi:MAG: phosphatidylinositol kinase, partial [Legionellales bacterium]
INVAPVQIQSVLGKDVLLIERFDRTYKENNYNKKLLLSGLSILKLHEMEARYASYIDLADIIRIQFYNSSDTLLELYKRLIFNILIGNTDDHARNHAAFWNGNTLELTPAYDICPQPRSGFEASQAMALNGAEGNLSTLANVLSICEKFQINSNDASKIIADMVKKIQGNWSNICKDATLSAIEQEQLWGKSILNPFCDFNKTWLT